MHRSRIVLGATLRALVAVAVVVGCGKGKKSTDPAVQPLELNSGNVASGASFSHRFFTAGAYPYHCSIHSGMTGIVVVGGTTPLRDSLQIVDIPSAGAFMFSPNSVSIPVGGKVTWTNSTITTHTVTSD